MVKFGARFETAKENRRWSAYNVDYERLKLLLRVAQTAHHAKPVQVRALNFGEGGSLLDFASARADDGLLSAGLERWEHATLHRDSQLAKTGSPQHAATAPSG